MPPARGRGRGPRNARHPHQQLRKNPPSPRLTVRLPSLSLPWPTWILVDNHPVPIYAKTESDGGRRVTGKIVAKEGLEFGIGFRDERGGEEECVAVDVVVDGVVSKADREIFRPWSKDVSERSYTWRGRRSATGSIRHFLFRPLSLTDDADLACSSERVVKSIGTIQLRVCRIKITGELEGDEGEFVDEEPPVLHEMSKKARVSHQAGLGPSLPHIPSSRSSFEWIDPPETPFVVFEFRYLSRTLLELEGIALPPSPSRPPPPPAAPSARAESKKPPPPSLEQKPRRSSTSSAGTPPPRSSAKPASKDARRGSSSAAVAAQLLPSPPPPRKAARGRSDSLEIVDPPPVSVRVRGAASTSTSGSGSASQAKERERLEKLERENREMREELERLRRGRLEEMSSAAGGTAKKQRREVEEAEAEKRMREKGKGKAREVVEELVLGDSDSD
ncbi:hypothetical protein BCR35DRAFT_311203 [Leucosporidium creatinivorum]|uniref:DUF7918 domain-containing protein n=1 Tax=Leucosporidium creatinivorum TaxID=106004 RepID=A0A1Y2C9J6_9BASI|nr:hypothetical protein BCR35DRAFT_311203 [Leucosporidium creatinivorum]